MRNLPRHTPALTSDVTTEPEPNGKPLCCGGFTAVKIRVGGRLVTIHCSECVPSPTASVLDDIEAEDDAAGPEADDLFRGWAA